MEDNPYLPPNTEIDSRSSKRGSPVKAVLIGLAVDVVGSIVAEFVIVIIYTLIQLSSGGSPEAIGEALVSPTSTVRIVTITMGVAFSMLGGFACARFARSTNYRLGLLLATLSACSGLLFSGGRISVRTALVLATLTFGSVVIGTRLGLRRSEND